MPLIHFALAFLVIFIWGTNFVVIKWGLAELPPLLFVTLRFALSALPLLVLPRPAVSWRALAAFGLLIGVGQFGLLIQAMRADISPGLASLLIQTQVFFTLGLSAIMMRERLSPAQIVGLLLAVCGMGIIVVHRSGAGNQNEVTLLGVGMVCCWQPHAGRAATWLSSVVAR